MNIIDLLLLLFVFIAFILGYKDGFVRKIIGLIGFVLAIILAANYSDNLGEIIESVFGIELYLAEIIGGVTIFIVIIMVFSIIKRIVHPFDKVNNFINQLLGAFVGVFQILFFLSAVLFILEVFDAPDKETADESLFYSSVYSILPATIDYLSNYTPRTKEIFKDYINEKDTIQ